MSSKETRIQIMVSMSRDTQTNAPRWFVTMENAEHTKNEAFNVPNIGYEMLGQLLGRSLFNLTGGVQ